MMGPGSNKDKNSCRNNYTTFTFYKQFPQNSISFASHPKALLHTAYAKTEKFQMATELKMNEIHTDAKISHKCNQCGYLCNRPDSLKRHMRVHSGEKPFVCSQCNYCCNQAGRLIIHMRIHSGEKCSFFCRQPSGLGVFNTLSDSIQYLNFAKKMINLIFDSILLYPRFNSKYYSIQRKFC